jgi:hypothetical protein
MPMTLGPNTFVASIVGNPKFIRCQAPYEKSHFTESLITKGSSTFIRTCEASMSLSSGTQYALVELAFFACPGYLMAIKQRSIRVA